ncbi:MAG: hypothetical protein IKU36_00830 [Bacteroidales bacterium]|nr:hypothetical protein [Bacteroidales bacterium]
MSRAGFFGSWQSSRYGWLLTFTRILMACVFMAILAFDALMYKCEELRFSLFGFDESWLQVCIIAQVLIFILLGVLAVNAYHLYCLEEESKQSMAEAEWLYRQELEKLRARLNLYSDDIEQGRFDNLTRHSIEDTHRMMERVYTAVTEIYPKSGYPEAGIGAIQKRLDDILNKLSGNDNVFTYTTPYGHTTTVHMNSASTVIDERMTKEIISRLETTEKSIKNAIAQQKRADFKEANETMYAQMNLFMDCLSQSVSQIDSIRARMEESVSEQKAAHKYEAMEKKLLAGQIDQILGRTEILETFRELLHKYAALMDNCEGDLVEFLKLDDLLSQDVASLKLGGDIINPLIKNGFDTIATLVMNDAVTIQETTKLGPKRMDRLQEGLFKISPTLKIGMFSAK